MNSAPLSATPLTVRLVGEIGHPDFAHAVERIRADACIVADGDTAELIVIAQSRPGAISTRYVQSLRRGAPLAGMVGLLGTWCEGETRTGRPWPNVARVYWYEFPPWWCLQLKQRAAGMCPEWARIGDIGFGQPLFTNSRKSSYGIIVLRTHHHETARALAEVFRRAGYATAWHGARAGDLALRGVLAGVWDGGQLDDREAEDLIAFCTALARDAAPVLTLLDFPRRDRLDCALRCGAAGMLGKPWRNDQLVAAIELAAAQWEAKRAA